MTENSEYIAEDLVLCEEQAFKLWLLNEDILHFDYYDDQVVMIEDVQRAFELYEIHSDNFQSKVLISFCPNASFHPEAREYSEQKEMPTPAQAIIIKNLAQRIIVRFYRILRKDQHPLKIFSTRDAALE